MHSAGLVMVYYYCWLVDNNATFCGTKKERGGGGVFKEGHLYGGMGMTDVAVHGHGEIMVATVHDDRTFSLQTFFLEIYALCGDFWLAIK